MWKCYGQINFKNLLSVKKNILVWRACNLIAFTHCLTGPVGQPFASCHEGPGFSFLLALSCYIGDPDMINHCGLVWGGLCPEPSLGRRADNVIIPLDLTQLFCPSFTLAAGSPSSFTTDIVGCWGGEPCGEPAISLHSHTVSLVVGQPFASRHEEPRFYPQEGTYVEQGFSC